MSSSPRTAPTTSSAVEQPRSECQPFPYASIPAGTPPGALGLRTWTGEPEAAESLSREQQSRALGRQEGQTEARKLFEDQLARERASLAAALAQFTRDRAAYFQKIESEVVQLALSVARKILHREAQLDPMLLAGIVRVALEKIDGATGVVLRLHPENAAGWRRFLSTHMEPADLPEIVEDAAQPLDCCTLETCMGTAVIGLDVQLKEIEHGLMDLLAARPGAGPGAGR